MRTRARALLQVVVLERGRLAARSSPARLAEQLAALYPVSGDGIPRLYPLGEGFGICYSNW